MKLEFKEVKKEEKLETFKLFKMYMKPVIENALGWDERFQNNGFNNCLQLEWFHWIIVDEIRVGLVCFKSVEEATHIHLLIIFKDQQGNGYGELTTEHIRNIAFNKNNRVTLSCFKNNECALRLYRKLEFKTISEDKYFFNLSFEQST